MPVQLFLSVFSQDSPKSLSSHNTSTKKGRKYVIFPVLTKLNQELCLYSPFTSTIAYKLFLQKGGFLTLCPQSVEKYIINISGVLVSFMFFVSTLQLF